MGPSLINFNSVICFGVNYILVHCHLGFDQHLFVQCVMMFEVERSNFHWF